MRRCSKPVGRSCSIDDRWWVWEAQQHGALGTGQRADGNGRCRPRAARALDRRGCAVRWLPCRHGGAAPTPRRPARADHRRHGLAGQEHCWTRRRRGGVADRAACDRGARSAAARRLVDGRRRRPRRGGSGPLGDARRPHRGARRPPTDLRHTARLGRERAPRPQSDRRSRHGRRPPPRSGPGPARRAQWFDQLEGWLRTLLDSPTLELRFNAKNFEFSLSIGGQTLGFDTLPDGFASR